MSFLEQPGFSDDVRSVLTDLLGLPPSFMDYTVQYNALNGLPIPVSQLTGFTQFTAQEASVGASESTASTAYTDLATAGPQITGLPDGHYLLIWVCRSSTSATPNAALMGVKVNSTEAADAASAYQANTLASSVAAISTATLNAANNNTVTARYRATGGTATFNTRVLVAIKYANL